jgi:hypothetical protein
METPNNELQTIHRLWSSTPDATVAVQMIRAQAPAGQGRGCP